VTELSLAFIELQAFVTSIIIGATTVAQVKENIDTINVSLSDGINDEINKVHSISPDPAP
jgi:aryl-alcohol dehydrogenase-like predicted oxidoreductase